MIIRETSDHLLMRDQPGCIWLFSVFFILIGGLFVLGPLFFMSDRFEQPWYLSALAVFMGLAGTAAGLWQANRVPLSTIIFRRSDHSICRITWGLRGRQEQRWTFSEVDGLEVVEEQDSDGDPVYRLRIILSNGQKDWLTGVYLHARDPYAQAAKRACNYLKTGI